MLGKPAAVGWSRVPRRGCCMTTISWSTPTIAAPISSAQIQQRSPDGANGPARRAARWQREFRGQILKTFPAFRGVYPRAREAHPGAPCGERLLNITMKQSGQTHSARVVALRAAISKVARQQQQRQQDRSNCKAENVQASDEWLTFDPVTQRRLVQSAP